MTSSDFQIGDIVEFIEDGPHDNGNAKVYRKGDRHKVTDVRASFTQSNRGMLSLDNGDGGIFGRYFRKVEPETAEEVKVGQVWRFNGSGNEFRIEYIHDSLASGTKTRPNGETYADMYTIGGLPAAATLIGESKMNPDDMKAKDSLGGWSLVWRSEEGDLARIDKEGNLLIQPDETFVGGGEITIPASVLAELAEEAKEVKHNLKDK